MAVHSWSPSPSFTRQSLTSCIGSTPTTIGPVCRGTRTRGTGSQEGRNAWNNAELESPTRRRVEPGPTLVRGPTQECRGRLHPSPPKSADSRHLGPRRRVPQVCLPTHSHHLPPRPAPLQLHRARLNRRCPLPNPWRRASKTSASGHRELETMMNSGGDRGSARKIGKVDTAQTQPHEAFRDPRAHDAKADFCGQGVYLQKGD